MTLLRKLLNTLGSVLLSLVLALIVWVGATSEANPAVTQWYQDQIPIEVRNQPSDTVIVTRIEHYVQVRVTAAQDAWETIRTSDFTAHVDLSNAPIGEPVDVPVAVQVVKRGIRLVAYRPTSITIPLEKYEERTVPVLANIVDAPPLGYVAREPVVHPPLVTVGGPAPAVSRVSYVSVDIWLRGSRESMERSLTPTPRDKEDSPVGDVTVMPTLVNVEVELAQRANFKPSVPVRAQLVGEVAPLYWASNITVKPASVTLVGLPSVLEEIPGYVETEPLDISGATAPISKRVALELPAGVSVVPESAESEASQTVHVEIEVTPVTGGRTMQVPVRMQGLAPDYRATLSPETIDVYLSGPLVQLQSLGNEDIEATVNLVDLEEGTHRLKPTVIVPEGIEITGLGPEAVEVQIVGPTPTPQPTPTLVTSTATAENAR